MGKIPEEMEQTQEAKVLEAVGDWVAAAMVSPQVPAEPAFAQTVVIECLTNREFAAISSAAPSAEL